MDGSSSTQRGDEKRGSLIGNPLDSREEPPRGPSYRWLDDSNMNLKEMSCDGVGWIQLAQSTVQWRRIVNCIMRMGIS
jgi:hypothetical protein